jgi:hypothetical protein
LFLELALKGIRKRKGATSQREFEREMKEIDAGNERERERASEREVDRKRTGRQRQDE